MNKIANTIATAIFLCLCIFFCTDPSFFVGIGSKLTWMIDKNSYNHIGIYFYDNDYIITPNPKTSTDYEYNQLLLLKKRLDSEGINLIYVNKPTKYLDDSIFYDQKTESFCNDNADRLLERLDTAEINYLDLRQEIKNDGLDIYQMFYRTDHHWTVPTAKWAAAKIARSLNEFCGYDIDPHIYDDVNYDFKITENAWLGEQGRKFEGSGLKYDDYTLVTPKFETKYIADNEEGDFTDLFIEDVNACSHYNYSSKSCTNLNADHGKILFLGDSYDVVTEPFLSLGVHSIDILTVRNTHSENFYDEYIHDKGYDTVIVCYAAFMIGAHDDPNSANHEMYNFV